MRSRRFKARDLGKILEAHGFAIVRYHGDHAIYKGGCGRIVSLPRGGRWERLAVAPCIVKQVGKLIGKDVLYGKD